MKKFLIATLVILMMSSAFAFGEGSMEGGVSTALTSGEYTRDDFQPGIYWFGRNISMSTK